MNASFRRIVIGCTAAVLVLGLASCSNRPDDVLPEGVQTMTGTLVAVPISLSRRGTHVLVQNGVRTYAVESTAMDLRNYEGTDVVLTGVVERNIDPDAPHVLVASGVTAIAAPTKQETSEALNLTLSVPASWVATHYDDGTHFTESGSTHTVLKVNSSALTQLPPGILLQIAGRKAVRTTIAGVRVAYVQNGRDIIAISHTPAEGADDRLAESDFLSVLRSVRFTGHATVSSAQSAGATSSATSSVAAGMPCGGPAGVLCPSGQYCEITDRENDIGRCTPVRR